MFKLTFSEMFKLTCNKISEGVGVQVHSHGPVTPLRMRETYELRMTIHKLIFIRTKSPWKRQNCAYTYRIEPMSSV